MKKLLSLLLISQILLGTTVPINFGNEKTTSIGKAEIVEEDANGVVTKTNIQIDFGDKAVPVEVIKMPDRQQMYGTVIRSLNNKYEKALYKPLFEDVSFIKDRVISALNIPAVYTGNFDNTEETEKATETEKADLSFQSIDESRETKILGKDILVLRDDWDPSSNTPKVSSIGVGQPITKELAIMASAKSLGALKYKLYMKTSARKGEAFLPVTDTPFASIIPSADIDINTSKYYTDIYLSRTAPREYWETAKKLGIVFTDYEGEGSEINEYVTLGELAIYLKAYMYLNGEAVMTTQEEQYLLGVYGRQLPTYLPSQELEAVKYLMARGIIDTDADFKGEVNGSQLMMYLMRAKDKDSRLTFKEVEITYNPELVSSGFYPVDLTTTDATMNNPTWTRPNGAGTDYFDYFIEVNDSTTFRDARGRVVDNLYVSTKYNGTSGSKYPGSVYLGIENGYYHFQIPNKISTDTVAVKNNNITINSGNDTDLPGNIKVQYGGGWYDNFVPDTAENTAGCYISTRKAFSYIDGNEYVDIDAKSQNTASIKDRLFLAPSKDVVYTFTTDNISAFRWDGKEIPTDGTEFNGCKYDSATKLVTITFKDSKTNGAKALKQRLTVTSLGGAVKFPAYMNTDDVVLVSKSFIDQYIGSISVTEVKGKKDIWQVMFSTESILVDTSKKIITSGQAIEELGSDEKSPLIVKYTDGEVLIDYRCLKGIINDYLVLDDNSTGVKAISNKRRSEGGTGYKAFNATSVSPLLGEDTLIKARVTYDDMLSLESSYSKANFILYKKSTGASNYTVLLVFKPKVNGNETSAEVKEALKKDFNIELSDSENCTMYRFMDPGTVLSDNESKIYTKLEIGDSIKYNSLDGYSYKIPEISTWDFTSYYKADSPSTTSILPIVRKSHNVIDINSNVIISLGAYKFPKQLINASTARLLDTPEGIEFYSNAGGYVAQKVDTDLTNVSIQYAPVGLYLKYYDLESKGTKDIIGSKVLFGSMAGEVLAKPTITAGSGTYYFKSRELEISLFGKEEFQLLNYGNMTNSTVYLYSSDTASKVGNYKNTSEGSGKLAQLSFDLLQKNIFDWGNFNLLKVFQNTDDFLTLTFIFLLNIVPRIMIMDFLVLATLAFVAKYPFIQFICTRFFDFYKVLSCFQLDVTTIDVRQIWSSTFWATVILGMLQQESLIHLLTWFDGWLLAIVG